MTSRNELSLMGLLSNSDMMSCCLLHFSAFYTLLPLSHLYILAYSYIDILERPFVILWNAPTRPCLEKYGVAIDLPNYDIIINQNHSFLGPEMVIFYNTQLGLYPFYDKDNKPVNGGLPQNGSLEEHLEKAHQDLGAIMTDDNFRGVAVVDWEQWRPLWDRNWERMLLYQQRSLELVSQMHPYWSFRKIRRVAKRQFQAAAQRFMTATLKLGRKQRPQGIWGFYGFPECYNFEYKNSSQNYSGRCPEEEVQRNSDISWLWNISQALYPHIYLDKDLKGSEYVRPFVRHRLEEAIRVSKLRRGTDLPVLPYARIVYTYGMDFLTKEDLIQTIGQSAVLGASGVILWGNSDYSSSKNSCLAVQSYVDDTLGKYLKNITTAISMCSRAQCSGNGRCVRKHSDSDDHLHLDSQFFSIEQNPHGKGYMIHRKHPRKKMDATWLQFLCRCYSGWQGSDCSQKVTINNPLQSFHNVTVLTTNRKNNDHPT
ncbi:hyaluronidase-1-like [Hyla sarda]|uniref:hyaluronidase-1-like n=1 Tax=Hyla sarda TaxID=327740 RepID=UPI0024C46498|nr:hyaluronidase-1-like [Hyla sarda]